MVFSARYQGSLLSVSVSTVHVVFSRLLDFRSEKGLVLRHVKLPRCGGASQNPRTLSRVRTRASCALTHCFTYLATPAPESFRILIRKFESLESGYQFCIRNLDGYFLLNPNLILSEFKSVQIRIGFPFRRLRCRVRRGVQ